jgi:hypothetical protein
MQTMGEESSIARRNAGNHVRGAGPGSGNGHSHTSGSARVAIGHVRRALLVTDQYVMNVAVLQRVIRRKNRSSGVPEYGGNPLLLQTFPEYLRACFYHFIFRLE